MSYYNELHSNEEKQNEILCSEKFEIKHEDGSTTIVGTKIYKDTYAIITPKDKTAYLIVNNLVGIENSEEILRLLFSLREFGEVNFDQMKFVWLSSERNTEDKDNEILTSEEIFFKKLIEALSNSGSDSDKEILAQVKQTIEEKNIEIINCSKFLKRLAVEPYTEVRQNEINYYTGISLD